MQKACLKLKNKNERESLHEINTNEEAELFVMEGPDKIIIKLNVNGRDTHMELDTGAAISVMTISDYKQIFGNDPILQKSFTTLKTYTNEIIKPLGKTSVKVRYKGIEKKLPLTILRNGNNPILGRNWIKELGLCKSLYSIRQEEIATAD